MRRWRLTHSSVYEFPEASWVGPHQIRLRPQADRSCLHRLRLWPEPDVGHWALDAWNNQVFRAWYARPLRRLVISNQLEYEPRTLNPFHFLLDARALAVPPRLPAIPAFAEQEPEGPEFQRWLEPWKSYQGEVLPFLTALNQRVHQSLSYQVRHEPGVLSAEELLQRGRGSCRDLSWLLIQSLRHLGFSARFVSGYWLQLPDMPRAVQQAELHAWVEVYLEGAGWLGLDPTAGLVVAQHHIPLARGAHPEQTLPLEGSHSASYARTEFRLRLRRIP